MKTTIIVLLLAAAISIFGMFYWMYKARKGELDLSSKSWHYKLKHWMWDFETYEGRNACPYYWGLVFSILVLPIYCASFIIYKAYNLIKNLLPKPKIKLPTIIPPTKKEMYSKVYRNSKNWLGNVLCGAIIILALLVLFTAFRDLFILNKIVFFSFLGGVFAFIGLIILRIFRQDLDKYWFVPLTQLYNGIWGLIKLPFIIVYNIIKWPIVKIFKIVEDNCPPIVWDRK